MNIYLIGYRGTGKSTLAPRIAAILNARDRAAGQPASAAPAAAWSAVDLDARVVTAVGRTIADIFARDGESHFRDLERAALVRAAAGSHQVVATGGGVIIRPDNRQLLRQGWVVWLQATADLIDQRLTADAARGAARPALTSHSQRQEIERLLAQRQPWYADTAHRAVDAAADPATLAQQIAEGYGASE